MSSTNQKKRVGDRKEGRRLRTLSPVLALTSYIMPTRNDACNQYEASLETTDADRWIRAKRQEGYTGMGMLHLFVAAYVRIVSQCPGLNRFIGGQKVYARNNIVVNMMVKRGYSTEAGDACAKFEFEPTDTVFDVYRKMTDKVNEIRASEDTGTEHTASVLMKIPSILLKFAIWILRVLDYFDILPRSFIDVSPFHGSMILTDLGSLGIGPIYHHIYNFGNLPVFMSFGAKRHVTELDLSGRPVARKYIDYMIVCDERIIDGYYYATAFKHLKYYLKNPAALEVPPESVVEDVF